MKNKSITYLLGFAVLVVWGLIIYRVLGAVGDNDTPKPLSGGPSKKQAYNDYALPKDTTHLLLNYRDPFGAARTEDTITHSHAAVAIGSLTDKKAKPAMSWSFIKYVGYIRNPATKKLVAMIHLNGSELMIDEGETTGDLKLIKNARDSIKISYQGHSTYIPLKPLTQ